MLRGRERQWVWIKWDAQPKILGGPSPAGQQHAVIGAEVGSGVDDDAVDLAQRMQCVHQPSVMRCKRLIDMLAGEGLRGVEVVGGRKDRRGPVELQRRDQHVDVAPDLAGGRSDRVGEFWGRVDMYLAVAG